MIAPWFAQTRLISVVVTCDTRSTVPDSQMVIQQKQTTMLDQLMSACMARHMCSALVPQTLLCGCSPASKNIYKETTWGGQIGQALLARLQVSSTPSLPRTASFSRMVGSVWLAQRLLSANKILFSREGLFCARGDEWTVGAVKSCTS